MAQVCSMLKHTVEGALLKASTIYQNLIPIHRMRWLDRQVLAQTSSSLANLRYCASTVNLPLNSTLNRYSSLETETIWQVSTYCVINLNKSNISELTSKLKFCLKFYFGDKDKQKVFFSPQFSPYETL